jgi:hypothetical protein
MYDHIHDLTYDLTYAITVNPHINTILQANDFNVSIPHCAGERSLAQTWNLAVTRPGSEKLWTEVLMSRMACALRPAYG